MSEGQKRARARIALCRALFAVEQIEAENDRLRELIGSPEVTEALRTVVTRDGAVLARVIEECRSLLGAD